MKNFVIGICKALLSVFFIFPIKKNRVFFSAYSGKSYSCNPKYICEYLLGCGENLDIVWAFSEPEKFSSLDGRIRRVRFKSIRHLYYLLTSRVVVDNVESWSILPKRRGQFVINTWHGGGAYKGVGLFRRDTDEGTDRNMINKHKRVDLYLSSSHAFTEMTLRNSFCYHGEVLECGMPRNDMLMNGKRDDVGRIREAIGAKEGDRLALFAPTFRHDLNYKYSLDFGRTAAALKKRFGGEWKILFRAHYYLTSQSGTGDVIDVTAYPDMQELLLASDVLITDYSSSIWDFALTGKPGFLYTPDLGEYAGEREFYTPIETWPYPFAENMDAFEKIILGYDSVESVRKIRRHIEELGGCESGEATVRTAEIILDLCRS